MQQNSSNSSGSAMLILYRALLLLCCWIFAAGSPVSGSTPEPLDSDSSPPRIMRYVSRLEEFAGQLCFGMVMEDHDGIPHSVCNLGRHDRALCETGPDAVSTPRKVRLAFSTADAVASREPGNGPDTCREILPQTQLAERVLAPAGISLQQLASGQRFIVGIGLNYRAHREETGAADHAGLAPDEVLVFPKSVEPTGAYAPVQTGVKIASHPARPVQLLDYEVELGMLLLEDLDLNALPASYAEFINGVAFFAANDVSDREPIILDSEFGYTRGKSHPTYLPIGPWMIHGRHLQPQAPGEGRDRLELALVVQEPASGQQTARTRQLQSSSTDRMILGPWKIINLLAARYRQGIHTCMRNALGQPRYIHTSKGVIPAGSIILTGTPGGTAIREPELLEKLGLFLRGGFSLSGARHRMIRDSEEHIPDSRYLEPGDQVETSITLLGRQRWTVIEDAALNRYGIASPGDCSTASSNDQQAGE